MQTKQEDVGHHVDAGWWARGHQVGSTDPTLVCLGWPLCSPRHMECCRDICFLGGAKPLVDRPSLWVDIWRVNSGLFSWPHVVLRFVQRWHWVDQPIPPHSRFSMFWISTTRRNVTCTCSASGNTPAELKSYFIQIKLFIQEFKYCRHFYKGKTKGKWNKRNQNGVIQTKCLIV